MAPFFGLRITAAKQGHASAKVGLEAASCFSIKVKNSAERTVTLCPMVETVTLAQIKSDVKRIVDACCDLKPVATKLLSNMRKIITNIMITEMNGRETGTEVSQTELITQLNIVLNIHSKREKVLRNRIKELSNEARLVQMVIVKIGMKTKELSFTDITAGRKHPDDIKCMHHFTEVLKYSTYLDRCISILEGYTNSINISGKEMNKSLEILSKSVQARLKSNVTAVCNIICISGQNKLLPILKRVKPLSVSEFVKDKKSGGLSKPKRIIINVEQNTLRLIPLKSNTIDSGFTEEERDVHFDVFSFQHVEDLFKVPFGLRNEPKRAPEKSGTNQTALTLLRLKKMLSSLSITVKDKIQHLKSITKM